MTREARQSLERWTTIKQASFHSQHSFPPGFLLIDIFSRLLIFLYFVRCLSTIKKAHHKNLCSVKKVFSFRFFLSLSQDSRVCVHSVSVSRRCIVGGTGRSIVVWIDWLQLDGWLGWAALRGRFRQLSANDFGRSLSKVVTYFYLKYKGNRNIEI